jgi:hypothetical protein
MTEESRLAFIRQNQHLGDLAETEDESEGAKYQGTGDEEPVQDVRLPSSFIHSPVWSAAQISDCLKHGGSVTLFITFTFNPNWPEINSELLPGQSASDRPDLVVRVYQQRFSLFMKDITSLFGVINRSLRFCLFGCAVSPCSLSPFVLPLFLLFD